MDEARDILVTFDNSSARMNTVGMSAPYRYRKRYSIGNRVRADARAIASEYGLVEIDHWPIRSLSIYCFVYRLAEKDDRDDVLAALTKDRRVESAQPLNLFETHTVAELQYDDTYAGMQLGLKMLDAAAAHLTATGDGVRVAIVDSDTDVRHEDLEGRISRHEVFAVRHASDSDHGTAVASIIGARSNNARGIVGVAPDAELEIFVSCWRGKGGPAAVCDSFTLLKALDTMLEDPPQVLNLSLSGPPDALLQRVLLEAFESGVVIVAADPREGRAGIGFPASLPEVIGVVRSQVPGHAAGGAVRDDSSVYAPGDGILVAAPENSYIFKSGSSLSAAHVSGVVALLLSLSPELEAGDVHDVLLRSQLAGGDAPVSVNACRAVASIAGSNSCDR